MSVAITSPDHVNRWRQEVPAWLAGASCAAFPISIAASQILLGASALAMLLARGLVSGRLGALARHSITGDQSQDAARHLMPQTWRWPLLGFVVWTLLSLAFSDVPVAGLSQIKKLILLGVIPIAYTAFTRASQIEATLRATLLTGTASAAWGLAQFAADYRSLAARNLPFYENYITHQITGFMSHWMTYGGQLMLILLGLMALLLGSRGTVRAWTALGCALAGAALLAAFTRGAWLGALAGFTYLVYSFRKWLVPLIPVGLIILYVAAPGDLRKREESIVAPQLDSSIQARLVMARAGMAMVADKPVFGVGPERVAALFARYHAADAPLPPGWYGHLHNSFLHFAAERGLPALFFFLWLLLAILRSNQARAADPNEATARLARTAVAATLGMMVLGAFEYNFGDSEVLMLYLFLATLPLSAHRLQTNLAL